MTVENLVILLLFTAFILFALWAAAITEAVISGKRFERELRREIAKAYHPSNR